MGYGPGASLTKQTGEIADTVIDSGRRVEEAQALGREQREAGSRSHHFIRDT
jgi:hypothetical protein